MSPHHAVVWLDHQHAKLFFFDRVSDSEVSLSAVHGRSDLRHRHGISAKADAEDQIFFHAIVAALKPAREWLITGPGTAKLALVKHIQRHDHALSDHIVGIETADHPSDAQIIAHARTFFLAADRLQP